MQINIIVLIVLHEELNCYQNIVNIISLELNINFYSLSNI